MNATAEAAPHILIVDDEPGIRESLSGLLEDEGYAVRTASGGAEALRLLDKSPADVVLLDIWMKGKDGMETLEEIRRRDPHQTVVMISGHGTIETAVTATKLGAFDFLEKPLSIERVLVVLENALKTHRLEEENRLLRQRLAGQAELTGRSKPIQQLRRQILTAAPTGGWVLITGENGTGKEIAARMLHRNSLLADRPLVEVNCAAIPEELIESELFGHEKGAFTGATARKTGKFETADGGTLFLDEIGDMSLKTQAKVLRVLQEGTFERVGGAETLTSRVRLICATNKNLDEMIAQGRFREDLYFRINVIPLHLPPLRERSEDIPLLLDHFLRVHAAERGEEPKRFTKDALALLGEYPWPGNVRELKNLVERLVIMTSGKLIRRQDLPPELGRRLKPSAQLNLDGEGLADARTAFERAYIAEKLEECGGNISKTAELLSITRENLSRKIKSLGIEVVRPTDE